MIWISGGTISGNWAMGRLASATMPTMTNIMEMTMATMGRLMKNFDMASYFCSGPDWRRFLLSRSLRLSPLADVSVRLRIHDHALLYLLEPLHNHLVPRLQPLVNHPEAVDTFSRFYRSYIDFVSGAYNGDLIASLKLRHRSLGYQQGVFLDLAFGTDLGKLSGPNDISGIVEEGREFNRACLHIHLAVGKGKEPFIGMDLAGRKDQIQGNVLETGPAVSDNLEVLLLADRDIDLDRIKGRDRCQFLDQSGADEIADLGLGNAGDAVNGRGNFGEADVQRCFFNNRLCRNHRRMRGLLKAPGIVQIFFTDGILLCQRLDPVEIGLGRFPACLLFAPVVPWPGPGRPGRCAGRSRKESVPS